MGKYYAETRTGQNAYQINFEYSTNNSLKAVQNIFLNSFDLDTSVHSGIYLSTAMQDTD